MSIFITPIVDVSSCAREPIHIPGSIQPYGYLLACRMPSWAITHVSDNVAGWLGVEAAALLDKPLETLLSDRVIHDLRNTLQASMTSGSAETLTNAAVEGLGPCDVAIHLSGDDVVIEIIPRQGGQAETTAPLTLIRSMLSRLKRAPTFERALKATASQIRAVTGFDRVMVYKFLDDDSGEVIAEALRSGLTPFLGLHYPASDIPAQARELYKRQFLRLIPDVSYEASLLRSSGTTNGAPLDLSLAALRSASPIHLEYLRNMGSAATLTISLMTGDRLWGLIACHHEVPRRLAISTCGACELFGQMLSLQIEAKEQQRELGYIARSREAHERLIASMPPDETLFDNLALYKDLLGELIPSDGVGIWASGLFSGLGVLPPVETMEGLIDFLSAKDAQAVYATDSLDVVFPPASSYRDQVSGLIAIPFSRSPRDYLLFFRRELLQVVNWGGNPNKAVEASPTGNRIGPRKSFASWREDVAGKSKPWHEAEVQIAEALRVSLLDVILRRSDLVERERRSAQETQALLVAELNHRVKNILALIRSLVRQSRHGASSIADFTSDLENRIRALALAHDQMTLGGWTWAPLRRLLETEAEAWNRASRQGLSFEGPSALLDPRAYQTLALVFHELMTNAAKYGALSTTHGVLSVKWGFDRLGELEINWTETGGPAVRAPTRRGFGSVVVEQTVPFELRGEAQVEYRLEGVSARFKIPADHVKLGEMHESSAVQSQAVSSSSLRGKRLLLVEDSMMIALDAQAALQDVGAGVDISGTVADAKRSVDLDLFDAVVLDINLGRETSFSVADQCVERGLPFVFATGYGDSVVMPERFKAIPVVSKPYDEQAIGTALGIAATLIKALT